ILVHEFFLLCLLPPLLCRSRLHRTPHNRGTGTYPRATITTPMTTQTINAPSCQGKHRLNNCPSWPLTSARDDAYFKSEGLMGFAEPMHTMVAKPMSTTGAMPSTGPADICMLESMRTAGIPCPNAMPHKNDRPPIKAVYTSPPRLAMLVARSEIWLVSIMSCTMAPPHSSVSSEGRARLDAAATSLASVEDFFAANG